MLLNGLTCTLLIGVECHQTLGFRAITKTVDYDVAYHVLVINLWLEIFRQLGEECELLEVYDEFVDARCALVIVHILEQLLEHACCSSRCGYELKRFDVFKVLIIVCFALLNTLCVKLLNAITTSCGTHYWQRRKTIAEVLDLSLHRCDAQAVSLNLSNLFVCEHRLHI